MPDLPVSRTESAAIANDEERHFLVASDGRADIAAGRTVTPQAIDGWIETVGTACPRPLPQSTGAMPAGPTMFGTMAAREVRISDRAARDLARVWYWRCAAASEERARLTLKTVSQAIKNLPFTPLASPVRLDTGARERTADGHTIVYDVEAGSAPSPSAGHVNVLGIVGPFLDEDFGALP